MTDAWFRNLVELAPDAFLTVDADGLIRFANEAAERLFGWPRADLIGRRVEELIPPRLRAAHLVDRERYQAQPHTRRMGEGLELSALRRDGREVPVEIGLSPLHQPTPATIVVVRDVTERHEAQQALRRSEERYRMVVESASEIFYRVFAPDLSMPGQLEFVSPQCEHVTGHRSHEFVDDPMLWLTLVHPDDRSPLVESTRSILASGKPGTRYYRIADRSGRYHSMSDRVAPLIDVSGRVSGYQGTARDVTESRQADEERARLQQRLQQAQRMEAIGRLAGGIAHDFNNILTVIIGNGQLAVGALAQTDPARDLLVEVVAAGRRAAELTRQLLAFSRRQVISPRALNLNAHLSGLESLLRRTLGEDISISFALAADAWPVFIDPSQLDQIVINLGANARDAMPGGGALIVETSNVVLDDAFGARHAAAVAGEFTRLRIEDTGSGMDAATLEHVFEPFFTTKPEGQGTGLGMATVYGIVKQHDGFVYVKSEPGLGTSVEIYLPRFHGAVAKTDEPKLTPQDDGYETLLLVEDNTQVRDLARRFLLKLGYDVLVAAGPMAALELCAQHTGPIHALVTDVVMSTMNGVELSTRVAALRPGIRVLYMSGYTRDLIAQRGLLQTGAHYLQKPFDLHTMNAAVRAALA